MLAVLTAAAFVIFAQIFMVAPILPALAHAFATTPGVVGLAVPAFLIPYGAMTLLWGPVSDRLGRRPIMLASLGGLTILTGLTALAPSAGVFLGLRLVTALGASGVVPIALALIGDRVPYARRGRALGWIFGGMAGGMAFGAAAGALAEPVLGWRGLFLVAATAGLILLVAALVLRVLPATPRPAAPPPIRTIAAGYAGLLSTARARRTYGYILINAVLQSGIYTWLGLFVQQRFGLGELGIGLTLLGYGIPGFLLGPLIGRAADHWGRARVIPAGVMLTAACALALAAPLPRAGAQAAIVLLSLGYDMTQPPLAGIVTDLPGHRGQAMGLNVFTLFTGFGLGALLFQATLTAAGFPTAYLLFGGTAVIAAIAAIRLFTTERPR
ncbi:Drug resistance transporter, Bcr/CflA family [Mycobacteroides abscessus subsp. abscessus]|nr:Drug resistance transporter, Bcr/CflA family [Mycobacteroides abscessus subsp. abscessus]